MTIPEFINLGFSAVNTYSILFAIFSGVAVGLSIYSVIYQRIQHILNINKFSFMVTWLTGIAGAMFFIGQMASGFVGGDAKWPQIGIRFTLWMFFSVASGLTVWLALHRHNHTA